MSTDRFDCVIAGAGAAGMFGALVAARGGLRVALIERDWDGPSNLLVSVGLSPAAGTAYQCAAGIEDSPATWAADMRAKAAGDVIVDAVAEISRFVASYLMTPSVFASKQWMRPGMKVRRQPFTLPAVKPSTMYFCR